MRVHWEPPRFNEEKATQAAAYLLKLSKGRMNYLLLIKLLYLVDRRALLKWGRPVTGDHYFSMKLGPVLSKVLELVTNTPDPDKPGYWASHISGSRPYEVKLVADPGDEELSEAEEAVIKAVFSSYGHRDRFKLASLLHRILPEWKAVDSGRVPITYGDILRAGKKSPSEIATIEEELKALAMVRANFAPR